MDESQNFIESLAGIELASYQDEFAALGLVILGGALVHILLGFLMRRMHRVAQETAQTWDDVVLSAIEYPMRIALWILVVYLGVQLFPLAVGVREQLLRAPNTALVFLLAWMGQRLIAGIEQELVAPTRTTVTSSADKATVHAVAKLSRVALWLVAGLMVLQSIGVSISGLLAFGGIGGIAVGFAAKDLLANFFGGLSIYMDRPFTVGDWIRSPDRDIEGTVENIGWRLTRIRTFDQRPSMCPTQFLAR